MTFLCSRCWRKPCECKYPPRAVGCTCDFSSGTRGMDRCARCDGTGSRLLFVIKGEARYFPNTRVGYEAGRASQSEGGGREP